MVDYGKLLLLANLALSFYLVGCIWAHEIDIFRSWQLLDLEAFRSGADGPMAQVAILDFRAAGTCVPRVTRTHLETSGGVTHMGDMSKPSVTPPLIFSHCIHVG